MLKDNKDLDLLQAARCEDLEYGQIKELTVLGDSERKIVNTLKQSGAHLLQGARGIGKSMLLRQAETEMDCEFKNEGKLAVYVSFKTSTLLEGVKADQKDGFQVWVGAKILQALHEKLIVLGLIGDENIEDPYHRIFGLKSAKSTTTMLREKIHLLQKLTMASNKDSILDEIGNDFIDRVNDISFLHDSLKEIIEQLNLNKIIFLFDEAAHTFIPTQQEIFFEIFKLLHGGKIAVKAAVYPSVTSYGRNFEIGHDAIVVPVDKFETGEFGRKTYRKLFRAVLNKRIPEKSPLKKKIFSKGCLLDQCIDLSTGNPRAFLHLLNKTLDKGYNDTALLLATQEYVDKELLPYHQNLTKRLPKYINHIKVGIEMLRGYIIPQIREKNLREKKKQTQSAFFTVARDASPNLKLALDILCYSGVLINKGTVKISERKTGLRYMVHLSLLVTEKAFMFTSVNEIIKAISLTDYREFGNSDSQIEEFMVQLKSLADSCPNCSKDIDPNAKFCSECGTKIEYTSIISGLLEEPVTNLSIGNRLIGLIQKTYPLIGDIIQTPREELMKIKHIKEVRSRIIKNAAEEFIAG